MRETLGAQKSIKCPEKNIDQIAKRTRGLGNGNGSMGNIIIVMLLSLVASSDVADFRLLALPFCGAERAEKSGKSKRKYVVLRLVEHTLSANTIRGQKLQTEDNFLFAHCRASGGFMGVSDDNMETDEVNLCIESLMATPNLGMRECYVSISISSANEKHKAAWSGPRWAFNLHVKG